MGPTVVGTSNRETGEALFGIDVPQARPNSETLCLHALLFSSERTERQVFFSKNPESIM